MPLKKRALSITLCIILTLPLLSAIFIPNTIAESLGTTKFYFTDVLDANEVEYDSSGTFPLLSTIPPTDENISSYPPVLIKDFSLRNGFSFVDNETAFQWFSTWATMLLDDLEGFDEYDEFFDGFGDLLKEMELILPNPLRVVECYEHTGDESIQLNGVLNYDLYFKTKAFSRFKKNDQVELRVLTFSDSAIFPTQIPNARTNFSLTPGLFQKTIHQSVSIPNVSKTINPGQLVLFTVEIIPGNKTISSFLLQQSSLFINFSQVLFKAIRSVANLTGISSVEDWFTVLDEVEDLLNQEDLGINITKDDISKMIDSLISVSFLYDSSDYPSSVTVPFKASDDTSDSSVTYYLHTNGNMNTNQPSATTQQTINLASSKGSWKGSTISRNKILTDASAIIYLNHRDLQRLGSKMVVEASLTYENTTLSSDSITLDRTDILSPSLRPYQFTFDELGTGVELSYGGKIGFQIELKNTTNANTLFRSVEILYDSIEYTSMLSFSLSESDHIQTSKTSIPSSGKIIVGDTVTYNLDITSDLEDTLSVTILDDTFSAEEQESWDVSISSTTFPIQDNGNKTITISLSSLGNTLSAYEEDPLDITIEIIGNTGYDTVQLMAEVSPDAVTYDTLITKPSDKEIVHGTNKTLRFTIENNNTGLWKDSYIFSAEPDKENISTVVTPSSFDNLDVGSTLSVNVTVFIPENTDVEETTITFIVESKRSQMQQQVVVNISVIGANVFESIYDYFEGVAESMGLTDVFGSYAPIVLASIIFIVVFFILIMVAFILTNKYVQLICTNRIKEINPKHNTSYDIIIKNPTNKTRTYNLCTDLPQRSSSWNTSFSMDTLTIPAKQQRTVSLSVDATDEANPGDWDEFFVIASTEGTSKIEKIRLFCSLEDGKVDLSIGTVFHWPKTFSKDEKVSTSIRVENKGSVQARNVAVKLFINNKEKNKVEELIIPAKGYADITLPWLAEKGKNDLRILVS